MAESPLRILRGDITKLAVDAIVNAANTSLLGGGGVDGAIHRAAGPELLAECRKLGGCNPGEAKITSGYALSARFVIHTVGPIWSGGDRGEPEVLANCYRNSLRVAVQNSVRTIAFPAISCGAYGYPIADAAAIATETTRAFLREDDSITAVTFVVSNNEIQAAYQPFLSS
jgi:O-acetyl-ADP-ribose deacetylase (regulator of RNase III)